MNDSNRDFSDFTIQSYKSILSIAKSNWNFIDYSNYKEQGNNVLWRHDIDLSPNRALVISEIEYSSNICTNYFINLHSEFYNPLEDSSYNKFCKIIEMNHNLGVHFDCAHYQGKIHSIKDLEKYLLQEKKLLENIFNCKINSFSFHNPDIGDCLKYKQDIIAGMFNTYGEYLELNYTYCSDSNGYWRFDRLKDVLSNIKPKNLQVLTHPGWWQDSPMAPMMRVDRCLDGRTNAIRNHYLKTLANNNRKNIE